MAQLLNGPASQAPPSQAGRARRPKKPAYDPALVGASPPPLASLAVMRSNVVAFEDLVAGRHPSSAEARETFDNLLSRSNVAFAVQKDGRFFVAPSKWAAHDWHGLSEDNWLNAYDAHRGEMSAGAAYARAKRLAAGIPADDTIIAAAEAEWHRLCSARGRKAKISFEILHLGAITNPAAALMQTQPASGTELKSSEPDAVPASVVQAPKGLAGRIIYECLPHFTSDERLALVKLLLNSSTSEDRGEIARWLATTQFPAA